MVELTQEEKRKAFWTWIQCNAEIMMPEAKRFLGNSDARRDFAELHGYKGELTDQEETNMMASVIEYGLRQAAQELKEPLYPDYLFKSDIEWLQRLRKTVADHKY